MAFPLDAWLLSCVISFLGLLDTLRFYCWADDESKSDYWKWCFGGFTWSFLLALVWHLLVNFRWASLDTDVWDDWLTNSAALMLQLCVVMAQYFVFAALGYIYSCYEATAKRLENRDSFHLERRLAGVLLLLLMVSSLLWSYLHSPSGGCEKSNMSCLVTCRKQDFFWPTWPGHDAACNRAISWKIFHFALMAPLGLSWKWYLVLFYTIFSWALALLQQSCSPWQRGSYTALVRCQGDEQQIRSQLLGPDRISFRKGGPYDLTFKGYNLLRWLCRESSRDDWQAFRKELRFSMFYTTLQQFLDCTCCLSLLADGQAVFGSLIFLSMFIPCMDDLLRVKFRFCLLDCYSKGITTEELWRREWQTSFFQSVTVVAVAIVLWSTATPDISSATSINLLLCVLSSLLFTLPCASQAAALLGDPMLDPTDFYEIQASLSSYGLRCFRRSLVFAYLCGFAIHSRYSGDLVDLPQPWQAIAGLAWMIIVISEVYETLVDLTLVTCPFEVSLRGLKWATLSDLGAMEFPSWLERLCFVLLTVLMWLRSRPISFLIGRLLNWTPWDADWFHLLFSELQRLLFCSGCVLCLYLLERYYPGWQEPDDKAALYVIGDLPVTVTEGVQTSSKQIAELQKGRKVQCQKLKVQGSGMASYVRASIEEPAGWITLSWNWPGCEFRLAFRDWDSLVNELKATRTFHI